MSKANWVDPKDIIIFQPASAEELKTKAADIEKIYGGEYDPTMWDWAPDYFPSYWLFYYEDEPVGLIRRDFLKRSVELHGHLREGYDGRGIQHFAVLACLNHTFFVVPRSRHKRGYDRIVVNVPDDNEFVKGFVLRWGFEKTDYRDGDEQVWRLTKAKFLKDFSNAKQESAKGQSGESLDGIREHE